MKRLAHKPFIEFGAGEESRTLDLNLGKVALYQLSYSRVKPANYTWIAICGQPPPDAAISPLGYVGQRLLQVPAHRDEGHDGREINQPRAPSLRIEETDRVLVEQHRDGDHL